MNVLKVVKWSLISRGQKMSANTIQSIYRLFSIDRYCRFVRRSYYRNIPPNNNRYYRFLFKFCHFTSNSQAYDGNYVGWLPTKYSRTVKHNIEEIGRVRLTNRCNFMGTERAVEVWTWFCCRERLFCIIFLISLQIFYHVLMLQLLWTYHGSRNYVDDTDGGSSVHEEVGPAGSSSTHRQPRIGGRGYVLLPILVYLCWAIFFETLGSVYTSTVAQARRITITNIDWASQPNRYW